MPGSNRGPLDYSDLSLRMKKGEKVLWTREESLSKPAQVVTLTEGGYKGATFPWYILEFHCSFLREVA